MTRASSSSRSKSSSTRKTTKKTRSKVRAKKSKRPPTRVASKHHAAKRYVYFFGPEGSEGDREMRDLLGGKGANLAEMCNLGLPVPPGFTLSTEVCRYYYDHGLSYPPGLGEDVQGAMRRLEETMGKRFGDPEDPLLVSVRSGARVSMPGMMDTVLNLGLNDETVVGLAKASGNERFAWDAYRRFVQMYGDVVMDIGAQGEHGVSPFSAALEVLKKKRKVKADNELSAQDLKQLVQTFKDIVERVALRSFPEDPMEQLRGAVGAVFGSWNNERAIAYRSMNDIPGEWGTAVSVVAMVFGNMGPDSGTGVAFTRDPATGEKRFYGEYLMNAQGEDVVAGLRTPEPIERLKESAPKAWRELQRIQKLLESHYRDMQDLEFTIQDGKLYMLQCRNGKRTGFAAVRIACDLVRERKISKEEALMRIDPEALNQLLQPVFERSELARAKQAGKLLTHGLNAGPGAATGRIYFSAEAAEQQAAKGEDVLLVRIETSPEDIKGMQASKGILTARGGMTSHAALVARQMGKVCVAGVSDLEIDYKSRSMKVHGKRFKEGAHLSLDGTTGAVYEGEIKTAPSEVIKAMFSKSKSKSKEAGEVYASFKKLMGWADEVRQLRVRTNADQPDQCETAVAFGAEGIGLCRTEHMFFGEGKIEAVREMILAEGAEAREAALEKLLPLQRKDFEGIFKAMGGMPVTIRTLDPPLHEFLPHEPDAIRAVAKDLGVRPAKIKQKVDQLTELNPMLGHRGCRLGITYPEITRMQVRAIFEAACNVAKRSKSVPRPEIMIPLISSREELALQARIVREVAEQVFEEKGKRLHYLVGTMIELPRAALTAADIAKEAEFFSFGTNDLTQTTFGISRDDAGKFVPTYRELDIFPDDPFASIDVPGVGKLMQIATMDGKASRPDLKVGICGEHAGEPKSIRFCHELGLAYVSCSPYRIPIARLAAAQAAIRGRL